MTDTDNTMPQETSLYEILEKARLTQVWLQDEVIISPQVDHSHISKTWNYKSLSENTMLHAMHKLVWTTMFLWIDPDLLYSYVKHWEIKVLKIPAYSIVITEEDTNNSFFNVILDWEVTVSNRVDQNIAVLWTWEPVWHYAFFENIPRTASVTTHANSVILFEFTKSFFQKNPNIELILLRNFARLQSRRLREIDSLIRIAQSQTKTQKISWTVCRNVVQKIADVTEGLQM